MEDCQLSTTEKVLSVQIKILQGLFIMSLYQLDSKPCLLFGSTEKAAWKSYMEMTRTFCQQL
jgi:hypothetical protein